MEVTMYTKLKIMTSALLASGLAIALPAFAQEGSASQSMSQAGQAAENAASSSGQAIEDAAHGTATVVKDSTITAKVKTALHQDDAVARDKIHVTTVAGVVTLKGQVSSPSESKRAEELAKQTEGVKSVDNRITVANKSAME
jgi:hyperosmotically inducible periplasmic protein